MDQVVERVEVQLPLDESRPLGSYAGQELYVAGQFAHNHKCKKKRR